MKTIILFLIFFTSQMLMAFDFNIADIDLNTSSFKGFNIQGNKIVTIGGKGYMGAAYEPTINYFDGNEWSDVEPIIKNEGFADKQVLCSDGSQIKFDRNGDIWINSYVMYKYSDGKWEELYIDDEYADYRKYFHFCIDSSNNVWMTTEVYNKEENISISEIVKYDGNEFKIIKTEHPVYIFSRINGLPGDIIAALPNDKVLIKRYLRSDNLKENDSNDCLIIDIHDNTIEKARYEYIYPKQDNKDINNVFVEPDNKIWFSYNQKFYMDDHSYCCSGMSMWDFKEDSWVNISHKNGLPYKEAIGTYLSVDVITKFDEDRYLMCGQNKIYTFGPDYMLHEVDGQQLFNNSLVYKCKKSLSEESFQNFMKDFLNPEIMDLPLLRFFYAQRDDEGNIWLMTSKALVKVSGAYLGVENAPAPTLSLHPNPTSDFITISGMNDPTQKIEIYTLAGVNIISAEGPRVDVSRLAPGFYFVRVGGRSLKFVKY